MTADYAELHCLSNFSFQRGASSADELFARARQHGYQALAITDECTLAGIVRAWEASKAHGIPLIVGSELQVESGPRLVLLAEDKTGYQRLCQLITNARRSTEKGSYQLLRDDLETDTSGLLALWLPGPEPDQQHGEWLRTRFDQRLWLAVELHHGRMTPKDWSNCLDWPASWRSPPWPAAMCTCTPGAGGPCRTP